MCACMHQLHHPWFTLLCYAAQNLIKHMEVPGSLRLQMDMVLNRNLFLKVWLPSHLPNIDTFLMWTC